MAPTDDREQDGYDDEPRRTIFSALWFRALIVVLVLGVVAAVAVPYVLDMVGAPTAPWVADTPSGPGTPPTERAGEPGVAPVPGEPAPPGGPASPLAPQPEPAPSTPPAETAKAAPPKTAARPPATGAAKPNAAREARGPYWIQVGAFRDQAAARRLAEKLRGDNYTVTETSVASGSAPAPAEAAPAADRYNVFVSGMPPDELKATLDAKGLGSEPVAGGVVLAPSLPLREAVALSRELATDGLQVQVRRAGGPPAPPAPAAPTESTAVDGPSIYRVRVGSFPDRTAARMVLKELEAKGYKPFLARGMP